VSNPRTLAMALQPLFYDAIVRVVGSLSWSGRDAVAVGDDMSLYTEGSG